MLAIETGSITTTSNINILITRQSYSNIILNSAGNLSNIILPVIAVSIIDFTVYYFNQSPSFSFVATDFTAATDWIVYTLPT